VNLNQYLQSKVKMNETFTDYHQSNPEKVNTKGQRLQIIFFTVCASWFLVSETSYTSIPELPPL